MATAGYRVTNILLLSANDEVVGPHTLGVVAGMAHHEVATSFAQAAWGVELAKPSDGAHGDALYLKFAVAKSAVVSPLPGPAAVRITNIDVLPEPVLVAIALCDCHPENIKLGVADVKKNVHGRTANEGSDRRGRRGNGGLWHQENLGPPANSDRNRDVLDCAGGCKLEDDWRDTLVINDDDVGCAGSQEQLTCIPRCRSRPGNVQQRQRCAESGNTVHKNERRLLAILRQIQLRSRRRKG